MSDRTSVTYSPPESSEYTPDNDPDITPERTDRVLAPSHVETPDVDAPGKRTKAVNTIRNIIEYSPKRTGCAISDKDPRDRPNERAHVLGVSESKGLSTSILGLPKTEKFNVNTAFNQIYLSVALHDLLDKSHKLCIVPIRRKENGEIELLPQLRRVWNNNKDPAKDPIRYDSQNGLPQFDSDNQHALIHYEYAVLPAGALDWIEIYIIDPVTGKLTSKFVDLYDPNTLVTFKSHGNPMFFTWNTGWHMHYWEDMLGVGQIPFRSRLRADYVDIIAEVADMTRDIFKDEPERSHKLSAEDMEMYLEIGSSTTDTSPTRLTPSSPASLDMYTDDNSIADLLDPEVDINDDSAKQNVEDHDEDLGPVFSSPTRPRNPRSNLEVANTLQLPLADSEDDDALDLFPQERQEYSSDNESSSSRGTLGSSPPPIHSSRSTPEEVESDWDGSEDRNGNVSIPDDSVLEGDDSDGDGAGRSAGEDDDSGTERGDSEDSDSDGDGDEDSGGRNTSGGGKGKGRDTEGDRDEGSGSDGEREDDGDGDNHGEEEDDGDGHNSEEDGEKDGEGEDGGDGLNEGDSDNEGDGDNAGDNDRGRQQSDSRSVKAKKRSRASSDSSDDKKTPKPAAKKARPKSKRRTTPKDDNAYHGAGPSNRGSPR
ncbi:hypothetical protein CYLTODRAFT_446949, partial [Cylindrobasidium torrendii FP15055 ss-10]